MKIFPIEEHHKTMHHFYVYISKISNEILFFLYSKFKLTFDSSASGAVHFVLHLIFSVGIIFSFESLFPFSVSVVSTNFAKPKSDTLAVLSSAINTLLAATSRCTI